MKTVPDQDTYKQMNDADLIDQFHNGNADAFDVLMERWQKPVHRFAYRYFADRDDAAEITQKTFIKAYHNLKTLNQADKFGSWIYRIANNLCIDEMRRNGRRKSTSLENWLDKKEMSTARTPATRLERGELGEIMQKALLTIPDEQRTVVILKEYEGFKFREIADILQEPENTVKSRMYYGLKALRNIFEKWNIEKEALYDGQE